MNTLSSPPLHVVVMAAGVGSRMHSSLPKVLHRLGGKPLLQHVVDTASALQPAQIHVVVGYAADTIQQALPNLPVNWVMQHEQKGTGHAVMQALPGIPKDAVVLVLSGDVPFANLSTLESLVATATSTAHDAPLGILIATLPDPHGLGRIVREADGQVLAVVEEKDTDDVQREIKEVYCGTCCTHVKRFNTWLPKLAGNNAQNELYLTDIIAMAKEEGVTILSSHAEDLMDVQGVNNRLQLQMLERAWQTKLANRLMHAGVTLVDAARIDIRGELTCGQDVFIDINVVFEGEVTLGEHCHIGPNCVLKDVNLGPHTTVLANSVLEGCTVGEYAQIGPFARIRPETNLANGCKVGNFVEMKKTTMGEGSKANHLSYVGDATIGKHVNIGAGMITCNYDGANKHPSIIGDGAFIGSDTQLVAPVTIGEHATIGAGSTIRQDAPANQLTLTESRQVSVEDWERPKKV